MYRPGDEMSLKVSARDLRGQPVAWSLRLREIPADPGKGPPPDKPFAPEEREFAADAQGNAEIAMPVRAGCKGFALGARFKGEWRDRDLPVEIQGAPAPADGPGVRTDRAAYLPGETMRVALKSFGPAKALLLTAETDRILFRRVLALDRGSAEVSLAVPAEWGPNFFLAATSVAEDRAGAKLSEAVRVVPVDKFLKLEIRTDKKEYRPGETCKAEVRVTDFDGKPRAGASVSVGVVDAVLYTLAEDRTPDLWSYFYDFHVPHRVAWGWFDRTYEFANFLLWKVPVFAWGRYENTSIGIGGGAGGSYGGRFGGKRNLRAFGGGGRADPAPRRRFRDLAFWRADFRSDAEGRIQFTFPVPDNLTRFRFTARGVTPDTRVGEVRDRIAVRKNFTCSIRAPEFLRQGDRAEVRVVVRNSWNNPVPARLAFRSPFPLAGGDPADAEFTVAAGGEKVFRYVADFSALPRNGDVPGADLAETQALALLWDELPAVFRADLTSTDGSGEADAVLEAVPFARAGEVRRSGRSGALEGDARRETVPLFLPADAELAEVSVSLSGTLRGSVDAGVEELLEYPFGCVEQTLSRLLPAAVAAGTDGDAERRERTVASVRRAVEALGRLRLKDGSWGWVGRGDASGAFMTAWAVFGLSVARAEGTEVPEEWIRQAVPHLEAVLADGDAGGRAAGAFGRIRLRILAALALSWARKGAGIDSAALAKYLYAGEDEQRLTDLDLAALAYALALEGLPDRSALAASRLAARTPAAELRDPKTAAFWLLALEEAGRSAGERHPLARRLLALRTGRGWRTTTDSALAVFALVRHAGAGDWKEGNASARVLIGERVLCRIGGGAREARATIGPQELAGRETVTLTVEREGDAPVWWTASARCLAKTAGKPAPEERGIKAETRVYVPVPGGGWVEAEPGAETEVGERVRVRVALTAAESREYVVLVQPLPTGLRPDRGLGPESAASALSLRVVRLRSMPGFPDPLRFGAALRAASDAALAGRGEEALGIALGCSSRALAEKAWGSEREEEEEDHASAPVLRVEARREALVFFLEGIPAGTSSVAFDLVASAPGRVALPAAWASPMYQPEAFGRSLPVSLAVRAVPVSPAPAGPKGAAAWADEAWVGRMLDFASRSLEPNRAQAVARSLAEGGGLRTVLVRELLAEGSEEAARILGEGFAVRPVPAATEDPEAALGIEMRRRVELLRECLDALEETPGSPARGPLLARIVADGSLAA
ncbi:MAG: hypothetical protein MUC63_05795, partial [Planctomycetes bacterium]|nr:hypothetical protein [Planctomycetota bacterium]